MFTPSSQFDRQCFHIIHAFHHMKRNTRSFPLINCFFFMSVYRASKEGHILSVLPVDSMSLACLVCHGVESPSHSFRSYSVSSSDNEGRCSAIANCLARKTAFTHARAPHGFTSSKVMPQPIPNTVVGNAPRLVRSHAVRRDIVRDWNFDEVLLER